MSVKLEISENVAVITLNRPDQANALDMDLLKALMPAAIEVDEDPNVKCVVLTGAGRFFCAGGDIMYFAESGDRLPHALKEITTYVDAVISRLSRMAKPLIVAINGPAAGAGMSLSLWGDIVMAAES